METALTWAAVFPVVAWIYLLYFRGGFWRADQVLASHATDSANQSAVAVVVPARNEATTIARTVSSVLSQDYDGQISAVVVDDGSDDGTAQEAKRAAPNRDVLKVLSGLPLEAGWTGKLWAVSQGVSEAERSMPEAEFLLLTDADIEHPPSILRRLMGKATAGDLDLVSLMVKLRCLSLWERLLIPAFVFFFQKLYPFPWVNDPRRPTAAAAGGCMLVRRSALQRAGGISMIRGELIDDCALARLIADSGGKVWLGLSDESRSLRAYEKLGDIWNMVARTAFVQLRHSALLLIGTVIGMAVIYLAPPVFSVFGVIRGEFAIAALGAVAWTLMSVAFYPTVRFYGLAAPWVLTLPAAAALYSVFTLDSARRHWIGRGGTWKGRVQDPTSTGNG